MSRLPRTKLTLVVCVTVPNQRDERRVRTDGQLAKLYMKGKNYS